MEKILFDLRSIQPMGDSKRHGGGNYMEQLFLKIAELNYPLVAIYLGSKWLNPDVKEVISQKNICLYDIEKLPISDIISKHSIKRVFSVNDQTMWRKFPECTLVTVQFDMRQFELPLDFNIWRYKNSTLAQRLKNVVKRWIPRLTYIKGHIGDVVKGNPNVKVITISHHSKSMILRFCPEMKDTDIKVFYCPSTSVFTSTHTERTDKYFLLVSGNRWEKNVLRAIEVFDDLFSQGWLDDYKVIITGAKDSSLYRYKIKNPTKFEFKGYVDDKDLDQLYHDAYCFVFPSLSEGFGYPPIEAMRYGIPVLASAATSIPEICGDGAMYFNPISKDELAGRIILITQKEYHDDFVIRSRNRYDILSKLQEADTIGVINYIYDL